MGKRRLIGKIVILMLGLAAVVILAANSDTIPVSTPKKGYRVVIDPGHGGSDCGAVGVSGVKEAGLNLAVSLYLKEELEALGALIDGPSYTLDGKEVTSNGSSE